MLQAHTADLMRNAFAGIRLSRIRRATSGAGPFGVDACPAARTNGLRHSHALVLLRRMPKSRGIVRLHPFPPPKQVEPTKEVRKPQVKGPFQWVPGSRRTPCGRSWETGSTVPHSRTGDSGESVYEPRSKSADLPGERLVRPLVEEHVPSLLDRPYRLHRDPGGILHRPPIDPGRDSRKRHRASAQLVGDPQRLPDSRKPATLIDPPRA